MSGRTNYTGVTNDNSFLPPSDITDVYEHFDPLIGELVDTVADLPSTGNWEGRHVYVHAVGDYLWDGSSWLAGGITTTTDANGWTVQTVTGKRTYVQTFAPWAGNAFGGFGGTNATQQRSAISPPVGRNWNEFRVSVDVWPVATASNSAQAVIQGYLTTMTGTTAGALIYYNPTSVTIGNTNMGLVGAVVLTEL